MTNSDCAHAREKHPHEKALDEELEHSFPASDPPQSTQPGGSSRGKKDDHEAKAWAMARQDASRAEAEKKHRGGA